MVQPLTLNAPELQMPPPLPSSKSEPTQLLPENVLLEIVALP
jgi:hypothetical protein